MSMLSKGAEAKTPRAAKAPKEFVKQFVAPHGAQGGGLRILSQEIRRQEPGQGSS